MEKKGEFYTVMKTFPIGVKTKGFLLIATSTIILAIFASFITSYKLTISRGKRISALLYKNKKEFSFEALKQFTYDELRRIDSAINRGEYQNAAEFVEKCEGEKIWLSTDKKKVSDNGYFISSMYYAQPGRKKSSFYNIKDGSKQSFKKLIREQLYLSSRSTQSIYVEFKKEYIVEGRDKKIVTKALIKLDYEVMERDPTKPQKEILKEFETSLEDI